MKSMFRILLFSVLLIFTGCATLPSPSEIKSDINGFELPKLPEKGKAMVYVVRPSNLGFIIRFNVFIDKEESASEIGYTRGGQYIFFDLAPGEHQILSKAENLAVFEVNAKEGDIIFVQQEPQMGLIMAGNSLFKIQDYEGKYHVKHLEMGTIYKSEQKPIVKSEQ
ncbi:MAG: hypothetical protein HY956_07835 [Deltaproteobacteria bacterium]|nr:hypothetical protein [Deltaproteobacteria bacterium]